MTPTVDHGNSSHSGVIADVERATTFGAVEFVRGQGDQVQIHPVDVQRSFPQRLHRIRMEEHAALTTKTAYFFHRLQDADLIVRGHDAYQDGSVSK